MVDKPVVRKYIKVEPIERHRLVSYMQKLTKSVEKKISEELPSKFGVLIDGWSDMGTSTQYFAVFAVYENQENLGIQWTYC